MKLEVEAAVLAGDLSWDNRSAVLESFDDHPALTEGQECFAVRVGSADDGDDNDDDNDGNAEDADSQAASAGANEDDAGEASGSEAEDEPASAGHGEGAEQPSSSTARTAATAELQAHNVDQQVEAVQQMLVLARSTGQIALAADLDNRLSALLKQKKQINPDARLALRTSALQRKQELQAKATSASEQDRAARREGQAVEREIRRLDVELEQARTETASANLERVRLQQLQAVEAEQRRKRQDVMNRLRMTWAAGLALEWSRSPTAARKLLWDHGIAASVRSGRGNVDCSKPVFWPADVTNYCRLRIDANRQAYASERFEFILYNNARQATVATEVSPLDRFRKLLSRVCPRYRDVCSRWQPETILQTNAYILDLAFLEAVWRYSHAVGSAALGRRCFRCWPPTDAWIGFCGLPGPE